jgi:hypothetical protein
LGLGFPDPDPEGFGGIEKATGLVAFLFFGDFVEVEV